MNDGSIFCFTCNSKAKQMQVIFYWRRRICWNLIDSNYKVCNCIQIHIIYQVFIVSTKQQGNTNWDLKLHSFLEKKSWSIDFHFGKTVTDQICIHILHWSIFCFSWNSKAKQMQVHCGIFCWRRKMHWSITWCTFQSLWLHTHSHDWSQIYCFSWNSKKMQTKI